MTVGRTALYILLMLLALISGVRGVFASEASGNIVFSPDYRQAIGQQIHYFKESGGVKLSFTQAKDRFHSSQLQQGSSQSISLGIGVDPVWLRFAVDNPQTTPLAYRLAIETPWLDYVDTYVELPNGDIQQFLGGDGRAFAREPMPHRHYAFESAFEPGTTHVYIRVETRGPMALPVRLSSVSKAINADISAGYQYGVLYGIIIALAIYNLVLFSIIRQREYGLYSLYLCGFLLNSLSYTGHIHQWFPTDFGPYFQDWVDVFLMITYSVAGLHFAKTLLGTKRYAPKLDKITFNVATYIPLAMLVCGLADQLVVTLVLAFILNSGFATLFIALGVAALKENVPSAKLFVVSSVTAAICIGISTMTVAGVVPYTDVTFKLIEVGMAFEGIFLAVILAQRFRLAQRDKLLAEQFARTDILTGMRNRRGFTESYSMVWHTLVRNERDVSLVLFDIDNFKSINDTYGHDGGDIVLKTIADVIQSEARKGDISARWGGEEFVLLLPETDIKDAMAQAERLRAAIANALISVNECTLSISASLGVAGTKNTKFGQKALSQCSLDLFLKCADGALYEAKRTGKNCVKLYDWYSDDNTASTSQLGLNI